MEFQPAAVPAPLPSSRLREALASSLMIYPCKQELKYIFRPCMQVPGWSILYLRHFNCGDLRKKLLVSQQHGFEFKRANLCVPAKFGVIDVIRTTQNRAKP